MQHHLHLTRRRFLQVAGAAPLCAALGAETFAPPITVFSKIYQELKLTFEQSAEVTAAAGLDGIDCSVRPGGEILPEHAAEEMPRYDEILRQHQARMLLLTTAINSIAAPQAETILRTAQKLGIRYYRLGYWKHQPGVEVAKIKAQLKELAALNRGIGVCGILQNHSKGKKEAQGYVGGDLAEMYDIMEDLPPDQIGVAFDLGHAMLANGDQWHAHFERLKPWVKVAYLKDLKREVGFVPFGQGEFGRTDFFQQLRQMKYNAPLSIHIEFAWGKTRADLTKTLTDCRRVTEQWLRQTRSIPA
jgi:sugar phosphate isomerase/epimerase